MSFSDSVFLKKVVFESLWARFDLRWNFWHFWRKKSEKWVAPVIEEYALGALWDDLPIKAGDQKCKKNEKKNDVFWDFLGLREISESASSKISKDEDSPE